LAGRPGGGADAPPAGCGPRPRRGTRGRGRPRAAPGDRYGFAFFPVRYWRGPVWVNINWFLIRGLERYGYEKQAEHLRETIVSLCLNEGFYEYFDPLTGMGHGSDFFSWTAALLLDVLLENGKENSGTQG